MAGCSHCCKDCQNPITWDPDGGLPFDEAAKQEIFEQLDKSYISGITFSGGDPLHSANRLDVRSLIEEIHEKYPEKTIWLYTGYSWEEIWHYPVMKYIDVLVDGEFVAELLSDNQKVATAILRGFIDNMAMSNNGQKGIRVGALDKYNLDRFLNGENFQFNANVGDFL